MKAQDVQREHFNKIGNTYLTARANKYHLAYKKIWWETYFPWILEQVEQKKSVHGLDAMCGNAEVAIYLTEQAKNIRMGAFDYSERMVKSAREAVKARRMNIEVWQDDILKLNKTEKKYDFVVVLGGLHHMPDSTNEVLNNIHKVLKPNGLFLNLEPTQNNPLLKWARKQIYHYNHIFEEKTERAFNLSDYNQHYAKTGFKVLKQEYPGLLGYILFYNPDAFPKLNIPIVVLSRLMAKIDIILGRTVIGKYWSFVSWTLAQKV